MSNNDISDDKLNLFIDDQLDAEEMEEIRQALLDDKELRERVCQLKAVRELVAYAYTDVPKSRHSDDARSSSMMWRSMAAYMVLAVGVLLGWMTYEYSPTAINAVSADNAFQYVANYVKPDEKERRIVLHIDSGDIGIVNAALKEADHLVTTYRKANIPMKLDVVTNKGGINILREDMSPYIGTIRKMITEDGVTFYACQRSVEKAHKKEGANIDLINGVKADKTAREIIPERISRGWVYIKA
jgi:intracellular sulfur oxidation DsrE/DsrF family protein